MIVECICSERYAPTAGMPYRPWYTPAWPVYYTNFRPYRRVSGTPNMHVNISAGRYVLWPAGAPH